MRKSNLGRKSAFLPQFNKWDFVCEFEDAAGCLLWEKTLLIGCERALGASMSGSRETSVCVHASVPVSVYPHCCGDGAQSSEGTVPLRAMSSSGLFLQALHVLSQ